MPVSEVSFFVNSFLDDLEPDGWIKQEETREKRCTGLALNTALSLLEAYGRSESGRILLFMGGPGTIGQGKIVGTDLKETIRNFVDFEKGNDEQKVYCLKIKAYGSKLRCSNFLPKLVNCIPMNL